MTANAGNGADGKPAQRSTKAGAKGGQAKKKTSAAAKPPGEEVTIRTGDLSDTADDTAVDADAGRDLSGSTVQDLEVPGGAARKALASAADDEQDAGEWRRTIPSASNDLPEDGEYDGSSGMSPAMDVPSGPGYGSPMPPHGDQPHAQGGAAAVERAPKPNRLTGALRKPSAIAGRKPPRKAHLQVARLEPWSVMKFSFVMSLVSFLVLFVAVVVLYLMLSWLGVFDALSNTIRDLTSNDQGKSGGIDPASWFSAARVLSYTALIGALNVLLITALATVWSVIYNMAADLVGGVEVTLKEADQ